MLGVLMFGDYERKQRKKKLMRDISRQNIDIRCLQETKIKEVGIHKIKRSKIITFEVVNKHYGNNLQWLRNREN